MVKAALQGFFERGDLGPEAAFGELGEELGVGRSLHQRVKHRSSGAAQDVARDTVELDSGVLERFVQTVRFSGPLLNLGLPVPGQVP